MRSRLVSIFGNFVFLLPFLSVIAPLGMESLACDAFKPASESEIRDFQESLGVRPKLEAETMPLNPGSQLDFRATIIPHKLLGGLFVELRNFTGIRYLELEPSELAKQEREFAKEHWLPKVPFTWRVKKKVMSTYGKMFRAAQEVAGGDSFPFAFWLSTMMSRPGDSFAFLSSRDAYERLDFQSAAFLLFYSKVVKENVYAMDHHAFVKDVVALVQLRTEITASDREVIRNWFGEADYYPLIEQAIEMRDATKSGNLRDYVSKKVSVGSENGYLPLERAREILNAFELNSLYARKDARSPRSFRRAEPLQPAELIHIIEAVQPKDVGPFLREMMQTTFYNGFDLRWHWYEWRDVSYAAAERIPDSYQHRNALLAELQKHFDRGPRSLAVRQ